MYYVATMIPHDAEDDARIARHLQEREGWGFSTLECGKDITKSIIDKNINGSFLFDSVTALLANEMFPGIDPDLTAPQRVKADLLALADHAENVVFVSDFIYHCHLAFLCNLNVCFETHKQFLLKYWL
jgi:adenosylcobinamide kinase/adenosylcobinamide-phosphate guanylyltransferase